jgi:serine/threonine protein kinase
MRSTASMPNLFKRKRPSNLMPTPKVKTLVALCLDQIEKLTTYNPKKLKNGQNGVVNRVTLSIKGETCELVKKQGTYAVEHENKMTQAIQNVTNENFPFSIFSLPVAQGSNGATNILYTCYQEIGDLQTHVEYIYNQYTLNPSAIIGYLFQGFQQLLKAINALHSSNFKDKNRQIHLGIIHNDIKPSNIFLKVNGDFILGDFGCAYFKDETASQISTFLFSAPEIFINEDFGTKSSYNLNTDLWSLGASLWYLLTLQLVSPFPKKSLDDLRKVQFYKKWAEKYSADWELLIETDLKLTGEQLVKQIKDTLDTDLKNLQTNFNSSQNTFNSLQNTELKKKILKKLALLMLAPVLERPNVSELNNLIASLKAYFVDKKTTNFVSQLLKHTKCGDLVCQDSNNNKLTFSR